jgi:cytoskeleton protein RodZ
MGSTLTAALIWLPAPSQWTWLDRLGVSPKTAEPAAPASSEPVFMAPGSVMEPVTSASDQAVSQAAPLMVSSVPVSVAAAAASAPMALAPAAPAVLPPAVAPLAPAASAVKGPAAVATAPAELVFAASEASWIEVRDAQKQVLFSGVLQPGDKKPVQGALPLSVVVGRAQGVSVTWRGQPFDLKPHTQVTVARFEVKP